MKISIITVNYNNDRLLEETILSVIQQTYTDYEYHIIDGGSTDSSVDTIKRYEQYITSWVSEKDNGIYDAMNKGIERAEGEYCLFLNSGDSFFNADVLREVQSLLLSDFNCGNANLVYPHSESTWQAPPQIDKMFFLQRFSVCHQSLFIRTALLKERKYCTTYKIVADYEQLFYETVVNNRTYNKLNLTICNYKMDGVSAQTDRSDNEKIKVIQRFKYKGWIEKDPLDELISKLKVGTKKYNLVLKGVKIFLSLFKN